MTLSINSLTHLQQLCDQAEKNIQLNKQKTDYLFACLEARKNKRLYNQKPYESFGEMSDICYIAFSFLNPTELAKASQACKDWNRVSQIFKLQETVWMNFLKIKNPHLYDAWKSSDKTKKIITILRLTNEKEIRQNKIESIRSAHDALNKSLDSIASTHDFIGWGTFFALYFNICLKRASCMTPEELQEFLYDPPVHGD